MNAINPKSQIESVVKPYFRHSFTEFTLSEANVFSTVSDPEPEGEGEESIVVSRFFGLRPQNDGFGELLQRSQIQNSKIWERIFNPSNSMNPMNPSNSMNPSNPINPNNPMNPINPNNPTNPSNPNNPMNPSNPTNPSNPINPMNLTKHFIAALATLAAVYLSGAAEGSVMINEALVDPTAVSDTCGEWIELYNDSTGAVDINGWVLKDLGTNYHQISNLPSLIIPGQGYLVLGRNIDPVVNGGYQPDYVYTNFSLANTQDEILIGATAQTAVGISYDSSIWPILAGRSVAYDTQGDITDASNWFATVAQSQYIYGEGDYGTPGAANIPSVPGPAAIPEPGTVLLIGSGMLLIKLKFKNQNPK